MTGLIVLAVLVLFALFVAAKTVRIIPQARAGVVERFGRYNRTLQPGLTIVVPFIDRVRPLIDLREQVVTFPPQPVITEDNVSVGIDTVLYFTITDPKSASYEVANPLQAIEQLTVTSLRNIVGDLTLEETLTSRDQVNTRLRLVLDERTGKWGIRINGVEIKSIDPPASIQEAMEKQMRAERDRRATILTAEGVKQAQILTAEGEKQSAVLKAQGAREAAILRAEGEAKAIDTVFRAIHEGDPDPKLLSYQYLQMLPQLAKGEANKIWVIPSEFTQALSGLSGAMGRVGDRGDRGEQPPATDRQPPAADAERRPDDATRSLPPGAPPAP
jgi:regulator of protease activity HflC (stomatin/prohibitin superfamily)